MIPRTSLVGALAAALLASPAAAQSDPSPQIDALFSSWATPRSPGCAVAAEVDGRLAFAGAYGLASLEHQAPATAQTIYEAGSVAKQFTAAAIILMAQDGRLTLEDDVRTYIPELPDYGSPITLRHLLNHTSGLRDWGGVADLEGWPRGSRVITQDHVLEIAARQRALNFKPGDEFLYSNTNYNLLALIVERVTGDSLQAYTKARIFDPLGMSLTQWREDHRAVIPGRATPYSPNQDGTWRTYFVAEDAHGNGGLLTTVGDLLTWNRALSEGRFGPAFTEEFLRRGRLNGGTSIPYASGVYVVDEAGRREISHNGVTGGYRAWLGRYPDQNISAALLCNAGDAPVAPLARRIAALLSAPGTMTPAAQPPARPTYTPVDAPPAGMFANTRTRQPMVLEVAEGQFRVAGGGPLMPVDAQRWRLRNGEELTFDGDDRFEMSTSDGDPVRFVRVTPAPAKPPVADYVGRWRSDEANAAFETRVEASGLVLVQSPNRVSPMLPAYGDVFRSDRGLVWFERDDAGKVTRLHIGNDRVRDMPFERSAP